MAGVIKSGSTRRFGSRYGRRVRNKLDMIETISKKLHKCPYCSSVKAKRVSSGIFLCRKCDSRFTGRAYSPVVKKRVVIKGKEAVVLTDEVEDEMLIKDTEDDKAEEEPSSEDAAEKPEKKEKAGNMEKQSKNETAEQESADEKTDDVNADPIADAESADSTEDDKAEEEPVEQEEESKKQGGPKE